jgi:hypothetical protein
MTIAAVPLFSVHAISILFVVGGNELVPTVRTPRSRVNEQRALPTRLPTNCSAPAYSQLLASPPNLILRDHHDGPTAQLVSYADVSISRGLCFLTPTRGCRTFLSGGFSVLFSLFVVYKIEEQRAKENECRNSDSLRVMDPRRFSFATQEVLARMAWVALQSCKQFRTRSSSFPVARVCSKLLNATKPWQNFLRCTKKNPMIACRRAFEIIEQSQ